MAETYCGKTCETCRQREELQCQGCKADPGRMISGDCQIARCCAGKRMNSCDQCVSSGYCSVLRGADDAPKNRLNKQKAERERRERLQRMSGQLGKWLTVLFWMVIVVNVMALVGNDSVYAVVPALELPFVIFFRLFSCAYGGILVMLAGSYWRYGSAGWLMIAQSVINLLATLTEEHMAFLSGILAFVAVGIALAAEFQRFHAHAEVLEDVDSELSEKWCRLWYWSIGSIATTVLSPLLAAILSKFMAVIVILAALIIMVVVGILEIVYLYRTARCFRECHMVLQGQESA